VSTDSSVYGSGVLDAQLAPVPLQPPPRQSGAPTAPAQVYTAQLADDQNAAGQAGDEEFVEGEEWTFRRSFVHSAASGLVSMAVHCVLLIVLGLMNLPVVEKPKVAVIEASVQERPLEEVVQRLTPDLKPSTQLNAPSSMSTQGGGVSGVTLAAAVAPPKMNTAVVNRPTAVHVDVGMVNVLTASGDSLAAAVPNGTLGEALNAVDGYDTAMDLLTREILNRLSKGKVLVVWVFDQSLSMKDDQQEIRARIEKVYSELGLSSAVKGDALWTGVVSYGKNFAVHTQRPTNLLEDIAKAIDSVPVDESGEEMMCMAIGQSVAGFRQFTGTGAGRQMMLVLVTDESGNQNDNVRTLEPAITVCKDARASVYVLGREAVFSYPYAHMNWTVETKVPGGGIQRDSFVVQVDRGPESPFVELLQTEGFDRRTDAHPSGFGPYEQVRLARETGGMFFMLPTPEARLFRRDTTVFDFESMRPYLPDARSREDYARERDYSKVRSLIWQVINDLNPYKPEVGQYINLRQSFAADPGERARQIDTELNKAKIYVGYLEKAEKAMREARTYRDREKSPRWRAHYDLILAQLVAYRARVFEYGAYLALFKTNPKPSDPPTPNRAVRRWVLRERGQTVADKVSKPLVDDSTQLFQMVINQYPGTPWATRAQFELSRGFGIDLNPEYYNPNPPPGNGRPRVRVNPPKI
jgi:hypothetical protein